MEMKTLADLFKALPEIFKNHPYMVYRKGKEWKEMSIEESIDIIYKLAMAMDSLGFEKGDKLCIMSDTRYEWTLFDFAMTITGIVNVPIYPTLTGEQAKYLIEHSEASGVIAANKSLMNILLKYKDEHKLKKYILIDGDSDESNNVISMEDLIKLGEKELSEKGVEYIDNIMSKIKEEDLASILYTSGTTGIPKGVMLSHKNFVSNADGALKKLNLDKYDCILVFLPLSHSFARTCTYGLMMGGNTLWYAEKVATLGRDMADAKPETMLTVPRVFENVYRKVINNATEQGGLTKIIFNWAKNSAIKYTTRLQEGKGIGPLLKLRHNIADKLVFKKIRNKTGGRIKLIISGASAFPKHISYFFNGAGIPIYEGYGLTEATPVVSTNTPEKNKIGTVGTPFHNVEVKTNEDGELMVKGPNVMQGYYKNEEETKEVITEDGWLKTGDICEIDSENFIKIIDRKKDMFKSTAGKYIVPQKIEGIAKKNEYIAEFVVIAENRKFASAMILPEFEELEKYAKEKNIEYKDNKELIEKKEIYELYRKIIHEEVNPQLASFELIKKFFLISKQPTIENGQLTPTLKIKRKVIYKDYEKDIENLYR
jgi:long-chain acyl-CoA synthetase